jgi:hypothetical protein
MTSKEVLQEELSKRRQRVETLKLLRDDKEFRSCVMQWLWQSKLDAAIACEQEEADVLLQTLMEEYVDDLTEEEIGLGAIRALVESWREHGKEQTFDQQARAAFHMLHKIRRLLVRLG